MANYLYNSNLFQSYFKSPNKEYLEYGYNVLSQKYIIEAPQLYELIKDVYIINTNKQILNKILNKDDINQKDVTICRNSGKGNCFYKSISQFYTNKEIYHIYYRQEICKLIDNKKDFDKINCLYIFINNNITLTYNEYFNNMINTGTYAGQYEIINTCIKFKCNICIYRQENHNDNYTEFVYKYETLISESDLYNPFYALILIGWSSEIH